MAENRLSLLLMLCIFKALDQMKLPCCMNKQEYPGVITSAFWISVAYNEKGFGTEAGKHPPMRGWLAVPIVGRDGKNYGLLQLSDKYDNDISQFPTIWRSCFTILSNSLAASLADFAPDASCSATSSVTLTATDTLLVASF